MARLSICRRCSDGTLWTPAGDSPFPLTGYNFIPVKETQRSFLWWSWTRWEKDWSGERWVFYDDQTFDIVEFNE